MFHKKPNFDVIACISIAWFLSGSKVRANMAQPMAGGYANNAGSYAAPSQQLGAQQPAYNYMSQPDPFNQYAQANAQQPYGSYNMQPQSYNHQYMQNMQNQWPYGNSLMNLGQFGSQQMQQSGYPYNFMQDPGSAASYMQSAGSYGSLANLFSDFNKPQSNKSQPNFNVFNVGAKKKN